MAVVASGDGPDVRENVIGRRAALLSGFLLALSFPPVPATPLPFVALVPLAIHLARLPPDRTREAWRAGATTGVVLFALLLHWIPLALAPRWVGPPAWVAAVGILALFPALAAGATHRAVHRLGVPLWLALAVAWTGAEWLRASLPGGLAFPWLGSATALAGIPRALLFAEWAGERGVTLWIVLVNGLVADAIVLHGTGRARRRSAAARAVAALALAGAPVVLGGARAARVPTAAPVRVAVVRTALARTGREEPGPAADEMERALDRLLPSVAPGSADLVLLPETAFPVLLDAASERARVTRLAAHAARLGAPVVVGGFALAVGGEGVHNAVFVVDREGIVARYDKRRLVPGVERTPLVPSRFLSAIGDHTAYAVGDARPPLAVAGLLVGPLVCFESAFAELARQHQLGGARLLVNVTNDAWFGPWGAAARAQHEAHLVVRAVEGRIGVARSANAGRALTVDPAGRVTRVAGEGESVSVLEVPTGAGPTLFVRSGDLVGPLAAALLVLALVLPRGAPSTGGSGRGGDPDPSAGAASGGTPDDGVPGPPSR